MTQGLFSDLVGKRALVTGASSGLGRHFATVLATYGVEVVLAARRQDALEEAKENILANGGRAEVARLDVGNRDSIAGLFEENTKGFNIIVNNAGIGIGDMALAMSTDDWDHVVGIDLSSVFTVAQSAAKQMVALGKQGSIVNIASIVGRRVMGGLAAYGAAKAGVIQLTRSLAFEWARHDIRVNSISPGYFETALNREFFKTDAGRALIERAPARRLGRMKELDGALLLLASDAGSFMSGSDIVVDGGHMSSSL